MPCRGDEVKRETVASKTGDGMWLPFIAINSTPLVNNSSQAQPAAQSEPELTGTNQCEANSQQNNSSQAQSAQTELISPVTAHPAESPRKACDMIVTSAQPQPDLTSETHNSLKADMVQITSQQDIDTEATSNKCALNDPAQYCGRRLKTCDISMFINLGPSQPCNDYSFPVTNGRCFSSE